MGSAYERLEGWANRRPFASSLVLWIITATAGDAGGLALRLGQVMSDLGFWAGFWWSVPSLISSCLMAYWLSRVHRKFERRALKEAVTVVGSIADLGPGQGGWRVRVRLVLHGSSRMVDRPNVSFVRISVSLAGTNWLHQEMERRVLRKDLFDVEGRDLELTIERPIDEEVALQALNGQARSRFPHLVIESAWVETNVGEFTRCLRDVPIQRA